MQGLLPVIEGMIAAGMSHKQIEEKSAGSWGSSVQKALGVESYRFRESSFFSSERIFGMESACGTLKMRSVRR